MAITPSNYTWAIEATGVSPTATNTGQVLQFTEANVDAAFWAAINNGGGGLRAALDSEGVNQLPLDVLLCDTVTETLFVFTRIPTYADASRTVFLFANNTDSQPIPSAAFGREEVWQGHARAWFDITGGSDRSGNSGDILAGGYPDNVANFYATGNTGRTLTIKANLAGWTGYNTGALKELSARDISGHEIFLQYSGFSFARKFEAYMDTGFGSTVSTRANPTYTSNSDFAKDHIFQMATQPQSGVKLKVTRDGIAYTIARNTSTSNNINNSSGTVAIGNSQGFDYDYYLVRYGFMEDSYIETENENLNTPNTFWAMGTSYDPSAAGVAGTIAFSINAPTFSASGTATLPQPSGSVAFQIDKPTFAAAGSATLPQPSGSVAFSIGKPLFASTGSATLPNPTGNISFTVGKPLFSATGSSTSPNPTGNASFTIDKPVFSAAGSATLPQPVGSVSFTIDKPVFAATGSATVTFPVCDIAFDISKPVFSATGSVTLPQPTGSVSFTIASPTFSATGTVSGLVISYADDAIITVDAGENILSVTYGANIIKI